MKMSEIRLVRCPKCDKVLPEPAEHPVYKCGGCGAVLRAKKRSPVSEGLSVGSGEANLVNSGDISEKEGVFEEGNLDMASASPARSSMGDVDGRMSPMRDGGLSEFDGGVYKSPMRDRFLNDVGKSPVGSRGVSPSPMRERGGSSDFDVDGFGKSPVRSRNVSKSPMRGSTPVSMRTRDVSRSPLREGASLGDLGGVDRSPARSMNGDFPRSPLREGIVSEVEENVDGGHEQAGKMTPKASFNAWISDEKNERSSKDNYPGRRTWRDRVEDSADQISEGRESVYSNELRVTLERSVDGMIHGIDHIKERIHGDTRFRGEGDYAGGHVRPRTTVEPWINERDGVAVIHRTSKVAGEWGRISASSSVFDGPSSYHPESGYGQRDPMHSFESLGGPTTIEELQLERIQLHQKYRDLKDQLDGLGGHGISSPGSYRPDDSSEDGSLIYRRGPLQQRLPDMNLMRPSHFNQDPGLPHNMEDPHNSYHHRRGDLFGGQVIRDRRPNQPHLSNHSRAGYVPGRSLDFDRDPLESYLSDTHGHHPACTCSLCYANRRLGNPAASSTSSHSMFLERYGPRPYDPTMARPTPSQRPSHLGHHHPRRPEVTSLNKRLCHPISSGAPFVLCQSCFQLLKLPAKFTSKQKNQHQLQCGACSTVMSFDLQNRTFEPSTPARKPDSSDAVGAFGEVMNESVPQHRRDTSTNIGSYDFDAVGYSIQSPGSEASRAPNGQRFRSNAAQNAGGVSASPSRSSMDERILATGSAQSSQPNSSEMPVRIRPPPGSPLQSHLDYSSVYRRFDAESVVSDSVEEKRVLEDDTSPDDPLDITDATETEIPSNEMPKSSFSQDSGDVPRDFPTDGNNRDIQPSIATFVRGFLPGSGRGSPGRGEVYVNGQTISHRLVKKAEKLAGKIQPGEYWYDPKAGFWGVMGHRCLGIIPPFIQEFSFPMPENCSRGDTSVCINGRELHRKDLDLLAGRGLPATRNKSYTVDISGKVLNEETREFIVNLGKLAPSVERNKCGFGMQVPEQLND